MTRRNLPWLILLQKKLRKGHDDMDLLLAGCACCCYDAYWCIDAGIAESLAQWRLIVNTDSVDTEFPHL